MCDSFLIGDKNKLSDSLYYLLACLSVLGNLKNLLLCSISLPSYTACSISIFADDCLTVNLLVFYLFFRIMTRVVEVVLRFSSFANILSFSLCVLVLEYVKLS